MRILTLTQPYATLVALLAKLIETRSWSTSYRGPLAIHAGAGLGPVDGRGGLHELCGSEPFASVLTAAGYSPHLMPAWGLPLGQIVAVAFLAGCEPTGRVDADGHGMATWPRGDSYVTSAWSLTDQERAFGDYSPGRYAWLLADVRCLRVPLPYRGAQRLRDVPADVAAEVERRAA